MTTPRTLRHEAYDAALYELNIAPTSPRTSNVSLMVTNVIEAWRQLGVLTDEAATGADIDLPTAAEQLATAATDADRLDLALTVGTRVAFTAMIPNFIPNEGGRLFYADRLAGAVASVAVQRGVFFMDEATIEAATASLRRGR